jgi:hypothetical protein
VCSSVSTERRKDLQVNSGSPKSFAAVRNAFLPTSELRNRVGYPVELIVQQVLARLEERPSRQWCDAIREMEKGWPMRLEVSLE